MNNIYVYLIVYFLIFIGVFLVDYLIIKGKDKKSKKKSKDLMELSYLIGKFKLDKYKLPTNKLLIEISLINAFIISIVATLILYIDINPIIGLLIGFIILLGLIYAIYELLGRHLIKKGYGKNGK